MPGKTLPPDERAALLDTLRDRFERNTHRHEGLVWADVQARLEANPGKLWSVAQMERTGGEPDVVGRDQETGECVFMDCAPESPKGRRSVCFDREAQESRKEHKPAHNALGMAAEMGVEILTEDDYRALQDLGPFDQKTSSWIATPPDIRELGGALFCDYRYGHVFTYHNGAQSYYAARGFRAKVRV